MSEPISIRFAEYTGQDPDILGAVECAAAVPAVSIHAVGSGLSSRESGVDIDGDGAADFSVGSHGTGVLLDTRGDSFPMDFSYCHRSAIFMPPHFGPGDEEASEWYPCRTGASRMPLWKVPRFGKVTTWLRPLGPGRVCIGDRCIPPGEAGALRLFSSFARLPSPLDSGEFVRTGDFDRDGLMDFAVVHESYALLDRSYSIYLRVESPSKVASTPAAIEDSPY